MAPNLKQSALLALESWPADKAQDYVLSSIIGGGGCGGGCVSTSQVDPSSPVDDQAVSSTAATTAASVDSASYWEWNAPPSPNAEKEEEEVMMLDSSLFSVEHIQSNLVQFAQTLSSNDVVMTSNKPPLYSSDDYWAESVEHLPTAAVSSDHYWNDSHQWTASDRYWYQPNDNSAVVVARRGCVKALKRTPSPSDINATERSDRYWNDAHQRSCSDLYWNFPSQVNERMVMTHHHYHQPPPKQSRQQSSVVSDLYWDGSHQLTDSDRYWRWDTPSSSVSAF